MRRTPLLIVAGLAFGLAWPATSHAFPDKDITFIIPYTAGGGFDRTVRALAPYMEKYLPKKVNVVPRNVAGAGGRKGIAQLFRAKPDGHTIAVFNMPGMAIPPLLGQKVSYDLAKVSWIARLARGTYALMGWAPRARSRLSATSRISAVRSRSPPPGWARPVTPRASSHPRSWASISRC